MKYIVECQEMNTFYERSHILFDVSLNIALGETVCLVGRNGVGKTTTFRSLMGLTPPKKGKVLFNGRECTSFPAYKMARLGMGFVPEDRRILAPFTVKENLELGIIPGRRGHWNLQTIMEQFPLLKEMPNRLGDSLSGGEQQLLTIARSLMGNPDVLLLDEPTEGLSPVIIRDLKELILGLKKVETTILLSEQNIKFAMAVSDRVVVLDKGHVVYRDNVENFTKEEDVHKKYLAV
ncbi:MAG: ABC transporter ATP-binding protein [Deltaproteobacteria bacterium]|nr:MAG: ABC transporter ATP-binding protein [Deltaproteobacteria bacterium]